MNIRKLSTVILGIPKSIIINFRYFPAKQAIKLPILVSFRTKFCSLKGTIKINTPIKTGMIKIGLDGSGTLSYQPTVLELNGNIICEGRLNIGGGSQIVTVNKDSELIFGNNVSLTGGIKLISRKSIFIGSNSIISWDTQIMDTDLHGIYQNEKLLNEDRGVVIGDNVWIGSRCNILKGCKIADNNVIASGSNIYSHVEGHNQVVSGSPIKVLKSDVSWGL
jgi:acetyltransferase-like isoleucine patch superfamily enzyme